MRHRIKFKGLAFTSLFICVFMGHLLLIGGGASEFQESENTIWSIVTQLNRDIRCHLGIVFSSKYFGDELASNLLAQMVKANEDVMVIDYSWKQFDEQVNLLGKMVDIHESLLKYSRSSQCYLFLVLVPNVDHLHQATVAISMVHHLNLYDFNNYFLFYNVRYQPDQDSHLQSPLGDSGVALMIKDSTIAWLRNKLELIMPFAPGSEVQLYAICFYCGPNHSPIPQKVNIEFGNARSRVTNNLHGFVLQMDGTIGPPTCEEIKAQFNQLNFQSHDAPEHEIWVYRMGIMLVSLAEVFNFSCVHHPGAEYTSFGNPYLSIYVHTMTPTKILQYNYFPVLTIEALMFYYANPAEYRSLFPQFRGFNKTVWSFIAASLMSAAAIYLLTEYVVQYAKVHSIHVHYQPPRSRVRSFIGIALDGVEQTLRLLFNQPVDEVRHYKTLSQRCYLPAFLAFLVIIMGAFTGTIVKQNTVPFYFFVPRNMKELAESKDFTADVEPQYMDTIEQITQYKNGGPLSKKIQPYPDPEDNSTSTKNLYDYTEMGFMAHWLNCIAESFTLKKVCIIQNSDAVNWATKEFSDVGGSFLYSTGNERVGMFYNVPRSAKYAPFTAAINSAVYHALAGGLMKHWYGKELEAFAKIGRRHARDSAHDPDPTQGGKRLFLDRHPHRKTLKKVLTWDDNKGMFLLLGFGLGGGLLTFLVEAAVGTLIKYYCRSRESKIQVITVSSNPDRRAPVVTRHLSPPTIARCINGRWTEDLWFGRLSSVDMIQINGIRLIERRRHQD